MPTSPDAVLLIIAIIFAVLAPLVPQQGILHSLAIIAIACALLFFS